MTRALCCADTDDPTEILSITRMPRSFIDHAYLPPEPSASIAFGGNRLDRLSEDRSEEDLEQALDHDAARIFGFAHGRVLIAFEDTGPRGLLATGEIDQFDPKQDRIVLLGYDEGRPRLAVPLGIDPTREGFSLPAPYKAVDYRSLAGQQLLSESELGQVAQAAALLAWHSDARFCGRCGSGTELRGGGVKRHCPSCARDIFPRTDPVVIMLTIDADRCLLGRSHHFPPGMYSALAGFVEAGETIETAVRRETFEEAGLRVGKVRYHASQPWPFPHSLMIGCFGEALETEIDADGTELEDCRWFSREEIFSILNGEPPKPEILAALMNRDLPLNGAADTPQLFLPLRFAIANRLIVDWAHGKI